MNCNRPKTPGPSQSRREPEDNEFIIITSDDDCFHVPDYTLFWASNVFANMRGVAHTKEITFTDEVIETSEVFTAFLHLANTLDTLSDFVTITPDLTNLLLFLRKWECSTLYAALVKALYRSFRSDQFHRIYPLALFQLGAALDDVGVCKVAINEHHRGRGFDQWWDGNIAQTPFDPKGWTATFWKENTIRSDYLHALMCSWHTKLWEDRTLANRFERQLSQVRHRRGSAVSA